MAKFRINFHGLDFELEGEEEWLSKKIEEYRHVWSTLLIAEAQVIGVQIQADLISKETKVKS